jgi:protein-disulfide isomerase
MQPFDPNNPDGAAATPDLEPLGSQSPAAAPVTPLVPAFGAGAPLEPPSALRPADARQGQNRLAGLATIMLVVVLAFGAGIGVGRATAPAGPETPAAATPGPSGAAGSSATPPAGAWHASLPSDGSLLGRADAKLVITYWADFQCPFCSKFAADVLPQLASRIADGTVAVRHRDFAFLGAESFDAAAAVRCGGEQKRYWPMHDAVYAAQAGENQGGFAPDKLAAIAASVGLDATAFSACIARDDVFIAILADTSAGVRADVRSTPTIDVAGRRFPGVTDVPAFLAAVDAAATAAAAGATPVPMPSPAPSGDPWLGTATTGRDAGSKTAPVTVQLWTDYQVTDMAILPNDLEPELRKRIAAGKVRIELHDLALGGAESVAAAVMVRCTANQNGPSWFVHDVLSVSSQGPAAGIFISRNLLRLGARLGLDIDALNTCLGNPAIAALVATETSQGQSILLSEAPAVVIRVGNREVTRFSGGLDVAKVLAAVDAAK